MRRQKDRDLRRRQQRRRKLRKLKTNIRQATNENERKRLLAKIQRIMVSPLPEELKKLDIEL